MKDRMKLFVGAGVIVGVLLAGVGIAFAVSGGDDDGLNGADLDQASEAAIAEAGGGRVTSAEQGDADDRYAFEVEVTRDDGTQVDVQLDEQFAVLATDEDGVDDDGPGDEDGDHDDDGDDRDDDGTDDEGDDLDDAPITEQERTQAAEAAVAEAGGGTATDVDREDDGGTLGWEVEVTLDDGRQVEVRLDDSFVVVSP
jgi:uncharacterized membrane protein YkoI